MAKKYLELFRDSAETQYASGIFPLLSLAALNEGVRFDKVTPSQTRTGNTGKAQYAIQRLKRLKAGDAPAQTGKAGDDLLALYNTSQKVDWDTVTTLSTSKRALLVDTEKFDSVDILEDASAFSGAIANITKNRMVEAEELATAKVFAGASNAASAPVLTETSTPEEVVSAIDPLISGIQLLVDDFKAYSDNVDVIIHPRLAKKFALLQGQGYAQGTNTFPNGLGQSFTYDGINFYVSPILNAIESTTNAGNVAGAIILDREAYANSGLEKSLVEINETRLDKTFFGHLYHSLDIIVDPSRVKVVEFTPTALSKKVND